MDLIARRFRGLGIAIVVLGVSAGAVFAGQVPFRAPALNPTAAQQDGQGEQADENDNEAPEADENDNEAPEAKDADEDSTESDGTASDNHGALVSQAAHMDAAAITAQGFQNRGEFVSCVAHMKDFVLPAGVASAADFLKNLKPSDCTETDEETALSPDERDETAIDNHGSLVSQAARMTTPVNTSTAPDAKQFANHGEFVSCVAHMKDAVLPTGVTSTTFLSTLTPDICAAAAVARDADKDAAKADKAHGKSGQHGKGRGHKRS